MHSLPGWSGVSTVHCQSPSTTGKTQQGRVLCFLLPGQDPEPTESAREREYDPDHGIQGEFRTLDSIPCLAIDFEGSPSKPVSQSVKSHIWCFK